MTNSILIKDAANVSKTDDKDLNDKLINDQKILDNDQINKTLNTKLEEIDLNDTDDDVKELNYDELTKKSKEIKEDESDHIIDNSDNEPINKEVSNLLSSKLDDSTTTESPTDFSIKEDDDELNNSQANSQENLNQLDEQSNSNLKLTNLDHLLSATLKDSSLSDEIKLNVLCSKIIALSSDGNIDVQPFASSILKLLIKEDMQKINNTECMQIFFSNFAKHLPRKLLAEILSVLIAVFKKSLFNVELAKEILLDCLNLYIEESKTTSNDNLIKHFLKEIIGQLCNYSCNVKELKTLIKISENDPQILTLVRLANSHQRGRPNSFFNFPGSKG